MINVPFCFQLFLNEIGFNKEGFLEGKSISEIPLTEVDAYHAIFVIRSGRGQMYVSAIVDLKNMKFKIKEVQQVNDHTYFNTFLVTYLRHIYD